LNQSHHYWSNWIDDDNDLWDPLADEIDNEMRDLMARNISTIQSDRTLIDGILDDGALAETESIGILDDEDGDGDIYWSTHDEDGKTLGDDETLIDKNGDPCNPFPDGIESEMNSLMARRISMILSNII
jgi:hypothetical protein